MKDQVGKRLCDACLCYIIKAVDSIMFANSKLVKFGEVLNRIRLQAIRHC